MTVSVASSEESNMAMPFEDGMAAYQRADYRTAMRLWRSLADKGHATAQFYLASMFEYGHGVAQDYATAAGWYRKAADQGHARAQCNLGLMYANGLGVAKDHATATTWLRKAADAV